MPLAKDLLHPSIDEERRKHKKKRLVQSPNSYFMDVKCPGCYKITTGKSKKKKKLSLIIVCFCLQSSVMHKLLSCVLVVTMYFVHHQVARLVLPKGVHSVRNVIHHWHAKMIMNEIKRFTIQHRLNRLHFFSLFVIMCF
jgi:ribosomal protein S27E